MKIRALATFSAMLAAVLGLAAGAPPPQRARAPIRALSDADLVRYASKRFDPMKAPTGREVLGRHRGTMVVVDFPCSDVCPQETRRIIHYDVPVGDCRRVRGGGGPGARAHRDRSGPSRLLRTSDPRAPPPQRLSAPSSGGNKAPSLALRYVVSLQT